MRKIICNKTRREKKRTKELETGLGKVGQYVQALVAEAQRADIGGDKRKVEISGPVAEGMRAPEGEDCECKGVVDGYVASYTCE